MGPLAPQTAVPWAFIVLKGFLETLMKLNSKFFQNFCHLLLVIFKGLHARNLLLDHLTFGDCQLNVRTLLLSTSVVIMDILFAA